MKLNQFTTITLCLALLAVGCSKEDTSTEEEISISEISLSAEDGTIMPDGTRTTLDGYNVTWNKGDAVGCMEASQYLSNHQFVLSEGAGTSNGIFTVVPPSEPLTPGVWIAYYPYQDNRPTPHDRYNMVIQEQSDDTNNHVGKTDWMVSDPIVIQPSTKRANFKMHHIFALVEIKVKLKDASELGDARPLLEQCVIGTRDAEEIFNQNVYFDERGQIQFDYRASNTTVVRTDRPMMSEKEYRTLWLLIRQTDKRPLEIRLYFTFGENIASASAIFEPKSILHSGKKYNLELELAFNKDNPNDSELTAFSK